MNSRSSKDIQIYMVSHQEVSIDELGSLAIPNTTATELKEVLQEIKSNLQLEELFYLATCNRVLFCVIRKEELSTAQVSMLFPEEQLNAVQHFSGDAAARHLFEVAASIHSLVVGEREILKQLRDAYDQQQEWALSGDTIRLLIQHTIRTAKRIYAGTRIGEKPVSVVSLAVKKFQEYNLPATAKFLLVGAGESIQLIVKHLTKKGYRNFTIYNRSLDRATKFANAIKCPARPLADMQAHAEPIDCVVACTAAPNPTVDDHTLPAAVRDVEKVIWIDLGVPADISPRIAQQAKQTYIGLSALRELAQENLNFRMQEVTKAESILKECLLEFRDLLKLRSVEIAFQEIPIAIKEVKEKAFQEVFVKDLQNLDSTSREIITKMMDYMEKKCIGIPMRVAKEISIKE